MAKNYINNRDFHNAIVKYYEDGEKEISKYLVECFLEIAKRLAQKKQFRYYTYIEDMKQDALVNCIKALRRRRYTSDKSNPFAYFTTVIYNAYLITIKKENKQKELEEKHYTDNRDTLYSNSGNTEADTVMKDFVDDYYRQFKSYDVNLKESAPAGPVKVYNIKDQISK